MRDDFVYLEGVISKESLEEISQIEDPIERNRRLKHVMGQTSYQNRKIHIDNSLPPREIQA